MMAAAAKNDFTLFQIMAGAEHGGAETFFERLALGFSEAGVRQHLAIKPYAMRMALLGKAGITVTGCSFTPFPKFIASSQLRRAITAADADIILSWMNRATMLTPRLGIPHVARLGGFYDLKYYRACDYLVANTKAIADYLVREGWPAGKVHVQGNFVPDGVTANKKPRKNREPVFTALGRFHANKGFDILLDALALVPHGRLRLAGDGPLASQLANRARDLGIAGRVEFLPWQADPLAFIAQGDVFVCPSRHEPFGNVIVEAFACKMPVITTATDAAAEYARHEFNALVVPVDDARALADAMTALIDSPQDAKKIAGNGYASYKKHFTKEKTVAAWIDFLSGIR